MPVLDSGCACGSTVTFAERGLGDVLLAWENEAYLSLKEFGADKFDIVYPPVSILAEPPVSIVDKVVDKHGTRAVAQAYLEYLYSPEGQEIAARTFYRPIDAKVLAAHGKRSSPRSRSSRSTTRSEDGKRRRRRTLRTAACSTRSTSRGRSRP